MFKKPRLLEATLITACIVTSVSTLLAEQPAKKADPLAAYREYPVQPSELYQWPLPVTGEFQVRPAWADSEESNSIKLHGALLGAVRLAGVDVLVHGVNPEAEAICDGIEERVGFKLLGAARAPIATGGRPQLLLCNPRDLGDEHVLEAIRHESAHIAQWCHGGRAQNGMIPIGLEQEQMAERSWEYGNFTYQWTEDPVKALAEAEADSIGVLWSAAEVIELVATECNIR